MKAVQQQLRSKTPALLRPLLRGVRKGSPLRLRAVRVALLRMRSHAGTLERAADVVEALFNHFRTAVAAYEQLARGETVELEDSESEEEVSKEAIQREALFYVDARRS